MADVVHVAHFLDAYPLCWSETMRWEDQPYEARYDETLATCQECLAILAEKS